jgi:hypothetical protein
MGNGVRWPYRRTWSLLSVILTPLVWILAIIRAIYGIAVVLAGASFLVVLLVLVWLSPNGE